MSDVKQAETRSAPLDDHGNYSHIGDLYRAGETLDDMVPRMLEHMRASFPGYDFTPSRDSFALGRSVLMKLVSGPAGIADRADEDAFTQRMLEQMKRFETSQGNVYSDYHNCSVYLSARVDARYHAQHAVVAEGSDVERRMSLAEFRRTIKVGDRIVLLSTDSSFERTRASIGIERPVIQVRSGDFIVGAADRKVHFDFPKAAAFACDGERFRISDARAGNPAGYRLYQWIRS